MAAEDKKVSPVKKMQGFPEVRFACFGGPPIIRILVYWGLYWGTPSTETAM